MQASCAEDRKLRIFGFASIRWELWPLTEGTHSLDSSVVRLNRSLQLSYDPSCLPGCCFLKVCTTHPGTRTSRVLVAWVMWLNPVYRIWKNDSFSVPNLWDRATTRVGRAADGAHSCAFHWGTFFKVLLGQWSIGIFCRFGRRPNISNPTWCSFPHHAPLLFKNPGYSPVKLHETAINLRMWATVVVISDVIWPGCCPYDAML